MDIRARILARPDLDELRAARDLDEITTKLNEEGLLAPRQRFVTARAVRTLPAGKAILAAFKAARNADADIDLAYTFLMQEAGLDIGDATTLALIDGLVTQSILTAAQGVQLKSLAMFPVVVDRLEVEAALYNRDTTEK
jgi:hypothetical protein